MFHLSFVLTSNTLQSGKNPTSLIHFSFDKTKKNVKLNDQNPKSSCLSQNERPIFNNNMGFKKKKKESKETDLKRVVVTVN